MRRRQGRSVRLWVESLPACQRVTGRLIWRSTRRTIVRMSWVRTCSGAGQIVRLARRLAIGLGVAGRRERLPVGAVHGRWLPDTAPDSVRGNKGLRLGRHGGEDAVLVESHAIGAAAVLGCLKAGAADLGKVSRQSRVNGVGRGVPCDVCSSDRQLQCAGGELAAGGAAGRTAAVEAGPGAAGGMDRGEEERASTHWGLAGGRAAGAGTADVEPCRDGALGAAEEGAWCSSSRRQVSARCHPAYERDYQRQAAR